MESQQMLVILSS